MAITRRQARTISKSRQGYDNSQFRVAYQQAKQALRENSDLRGKDLRQQARWNVMGIPVLEHEGIQSEMPRINETLEARAPKEGYIEVGPLTEVGAVIPEHTRKVVKRTPITPEYPSSVNNASRDRADAWYQFQHEVDRYNRTNTNYRPYQDSAAYQAYLEEEFNRIYNSRDANGNFHQVYHEPTNEDLIRLHNTALTMGGLPMSRQRREEYGVDWNGNMFDLSGKGTEYGRRGTGIGGGVYQNAYDTMAAAVALPVVAELIGMTPEVGKFVGDGLKQIGSNFKRGLESARTGYARDAYPRTNWQAQTRTSGGQFGYKPQSMLKTKPSYTNSYIQHSTEPYYLEQGINLPLRKFGGRLCTR